METNAIHAAAEAQARAVEAARAATTRTVTAPWWYWTVAGVLVGFGIFAVSSGVGWLVIVAVVVIFGGGRMADYALARTRGIQFSRVFGRSTWPLAVAWFLCLVVLAVLGRIIVGGFSVMWLGALPAVSALVITVLFGFGHTRTRLRQGRLASA